MRMLPRRPWPVGIVVHILFISRNSLSTILEFEAIQKESLSALQAASLICSLVVHAKYLLLANWFFQLEDSPRKTYRHFGDS